MTSKEIAAIIVEAGIIPPCDEKEAVEKLSSYGFVDDDMADLLEACKSALLLCDGANPSHEAVYHQLNTAINKADLP